jgi:hypothetical protein
MAGIGKRGSRLAGADETGVPQPPVNPLALRGCRHR